MSRGGVIARLALVALVVAVLTLAPACGGGGGGGGPTQPPPPQNGITFTPAGAAGADSVSLSRRGQSATTLTLDVQVNQVADLYGLSFDLRFPASALTFTGFSEGTVLNAGGNQTSIQVVESPAGNLVVGITRLGAVAGVTGSGTLLTLQFSAAASGNGALSFADGRAFTPDGTIDTIEFVGGSVQVVQ